MLNLIKKLRIGAAVALTTIGLTVAANAADTVRYATDGPSLGAIVILANEKGFFKDQGIDAIVQSFGNGLDSVDSVLAGQSDFGVVVDTPLISRLATGKLEVPAVLTMLKPGFHKFYARKDIKFPEGMKGKTVGVVTGTSQDFVTRTHIKTLGLNEGTDVKVKNFSDVFSVVGAMKAGRIDAAWVWLQSAKTMSEDPKFVLVSDDSVIEKPGSAMLVTTKEFSKSNPELMVKTMKALDTAAKYIADNLEESAKIIADKSGADTERVKDTVANMHYKITLANLPVNSLKEKYDFFVSVGKVEPFDFMGQFNGNALSKALPGVEIADSVAK